MRLSGASIFSFDFVRVDIIADPRASAETHGASATGDASTGAAAVGAWVLMLTGILCCWCCYCLCPSCFLLSCWQTHGPLSFAVSTVVLFCFCLLSAWLKLRCHEVEERWGLIHTSGALGSRGYCSCSRSSGSSSSRWVQQMQHAVACAVQPVYVSEAAGGQGGGHLPHVLPYRDDAQQPLAPDALPSDGDPAPKADTSSVIPCAAAASLHPAACCHSSGTSRTGTATSLIGVSRRISAAAAYPADSVGEPADAEKTQQGSNTAEGDAHAEENELLSGGAGHGEQKADPQLRQLYPIQVEQPEYLQQRQVLQQRQEPARQRTQVFLTIETWLLTFFAAAIDWGLMLVCMTFNAGFFLVIVGGIATGRALTTASLASSFSHWSWLQQQEQHG